MNISLRLRIKKGSDGKIASFAIHRSDGTVTVMRNPHPFFPAHDLTHYAVETTLGFKRGFYGLVSEGWSFADFGAPWPRGRIPADADPAELIVGFFDLERATGDEWTADEFNEKIREYYDQRFGGPLPKALVESELEAIRALMGRLILRWHTLPPGETLELSYSPGAPAPEATGDGREGLVR